DEFRRLPFIMKFITYPGAEELATPIPDEQIEQIQFLLKHSESPVTFSTHIEIGDAVRIVKGPLKGSIGYCCGASNSEVAIHLDMLGYATTYVPIANIEIIS
ncbi:MAG: transcriptional regulator, partial [Bacteroidales bacterium]|nr:transcriptional regulator [Bacteroidales bacterium]